MRSTTHTARAFRLAVVAVLGEQARSRDSYALCAMGMGSKPSQIFQAQDRVGNPDRRAPFQ
jgi:hypothetical protein